MQRKLQEKLDERAEKNPEIPAEEPLPVESQLSMIEEQVGPGRGTRIPGVGRCLQREPKKRGGCSRMDVDQLVEERVQERMESMEKSVEERMEKKMEERLEQRLAAMLAARMEQYERQLQQLQGGTPPNNPSTSNP